MCNCANLNDCGPYDHLMDDMSAMRSTGGYQRTLGDDELSVSTSQKNTTPVQVAPVTVLHSPDEPPRPKTLSEINRKATSDLIEHNQVVVGALGGITATAIVWAIVHSVKKGKKRG